MSNARVYCAHPGRHELDEDVNLDGFDLMGAYVAAIRFAAVFAGRKRPGFVPEIAIEVDGGFVLKAPLLTELRWPSGLVPDFVWRWLDGYRDETRARLVASAETCVMLRDAVQKWADWGQKVNLLMDDERRTTLGLIVASVLPALPAVGMSKGDRETLYKDVALLAWMATQDRLPLPDNRKHALNHVLTLLDELLVSRAA